STPQTVRTLRAQGQQLLQYPYLSPTFRKSLDCFIKGSLVQAQTGAEALDHLQLSEAASNARKARQQQNRRVVQKGGVIYASEARKMVRKREEDDVAKAQAALSAAENKARRARKAFMKDLHEDIKACVRLRN